MPHTLAPASVSPDSDQAFITTEYRIRNGVGLQGDIVSLGGQAFQLDQNGLGSFRSFPGPRFGVVIQYSCVDTYGGRCRRLFHLPQQRVGGGIVVRRETGNYGVAKDNWVEFDESVTGLVSLAHFL